MPYGTVNHDSTVLSNLNLISIEQKKHPHALNVNSQMVKSTSTLNSALIA